MEMIRCAIVLLLLRPSRSEDFYELLSDETAPTKGSSLSLADFQSLLHTEVNDEIEHIFADGSTDEDENFIYRKLKRKLKQPEKLPELVWDQMVDHGWQLTKHFAHRNITDTPDASKEDWDSLFPFLVCSRTPLLKSGAQRLPPIIQFTGAQEKDIVIVSNDDNQTCVIVTTSFKNAKFVDNAISNDEYVITPLTDLMKISTSTMQQVQSKEWSIPSANQRFHQVLRGEGYTPNWERVIRVTFAEGGRDEESSGKLLMQKGHAILSDIKTMGIEGSKRRQRRLSSNPTHDGKEFISLTDAFSLTSSITLNEKTYRNARALSSSRINFFSRSLEFGIEASHCCETMFQYLAMRPVIEGNSIDIILNPELNSTMMHSLQDLKVESSASNSHCVISLVIGLSLHPQVRNIEIEWPVSLDDHQSQWISQSGIDGYRPLFDLGLTGKDQIISVTDSGLDIDNKFFGPTSDEIHNKWITTERKVVRYQQSTAGDKLDRYQGHGTRVAGLIAGSTFGDEEDEADGVARDAKIHMWDIERAGGGFTVPGPNTLFSSIDNDGKGAKITNGSWSARYRPYSTRCRLYDSSLRDDKYDDILVVASAGNAANDVPGKTTNTIGEPASCKNIIAVGASQSHGERLYMFDKGKDYLADFSSRGPTVDGRMKPDVVAVGYTCLVPRAHFNLSNKEETYETFGTSFSAPVVSGSAALIRQYFEEGWFPCGTKGCGRAISPCGALVKAVLANGAQSLKGVQKVPSGPITEELSDYDNGQGFGLINLAKSIPLKDVNQLNGFLVNNRALQDGDSDSIILRTKKCSSPELSVTISWYDPAGAVNCAKCLVNDLDLSIRHGEKKFYPNGRDDPDRLNNMERIRLTVAAGENVEVVVKAKNLATTSQKYSLIATGCFDAISENSTEGIFPC